MEFKIALIIMGLVSIIGGYMVKQQRWLSFHFGVRKIKVDIPKFTQYIYKKDYLCGFVCICMGVLGLIFEVSFLIPATILFVIMFVFDIYAENKFKIK
ncbi:MAG: hypothetical protein R3Y32_07040 [Bacillota bacterium]